MTSWSNSVASVVTSCVVLDSVGGECYRRRRSRVSGRGLLVDRKRYEVNACEEVILGCLCSECDDDDDDDDRRTATTTTTTTRTANFESLDLSHQLADERRRRDDDDDGQRR